MEHLIKVPPRNLETLLICSFRYALGRKTYIVSDIVEQLTFYRPIISEHLRKQICDDIRIAIKNDEAGMDQDVKSWRKVLDSYIY